MATLFQGKNGGAPFPRTEQEWVEKKMGQGFSYEAASEFGTRKIRDDVFGEGHKVDTKGNPIEAGKGSAAQPTSQHHQALAISQEAEAKRRMTMGWHPGLVDAYDPRETPRRKQTRKKQTRKAAPPAAAEA